MVADSKKTELVLYEVAVVDAGSAGYHGGGGAMRSLLQCELSGFYAGLWFGISIQTSYNHFCIGFGFRKLCICLTMENTFSRISDCSTYGTAMYLLIVDRGCQHETYNRLSSGASMRIKVLTIDPCYLC